MLCVLAFQIDPTLPVGKYKQNPRMVVTILTWTCSLYENISNVCNQQVQVYLTVVPFLGYRVCLVQYQNSLFKCEDITLRRIYCLTVIAWNRVSEHVDMAPLPNCFKNRLDKLYLKAIGNKCISSLAASVSYLGKVVCDVHIFLISQGFLHNT